MTNVSAGCVPTDASLLGMMRHLLHRMCPAACALLFVLPITFVFAQASENASAEREVRDMERRWREAWLAADAAAMERLYADDYIAIPNIGTVSTRAEILADVRRGVFRYSRMEHSEMTVRIYDVTAVVVGRTSNEGRRGDRDVSGDFRYTRIYVKRSGHWRAVLAQYTRVAPSGK
jgi:ketosteroid isomerase-like protein